MTLAGITTLCRLVQPSNAASVIFTSPSGRIRFVSDLQSANAYISILVAACGNSIDERLVQPLKMLCGMLVRFFGN